MCLVRSTSPCLDGLTHIDVSARLYWRMSRVVLVVVVVVEVVVVVVVVARRQQSYLARLYTMARAAKRKTEGDAGRGATFAAHHIGMTSNANASQRGNGKQRERR